MAGHLFKHFTFSLFMSSISESDALKIILRIAIVKCRIPLELVSFTFLCLDKSFPWFLGGNYVL